MSEASNPTARQTLAAALAKSQAVLRRRALVAGFLGGLPALAWLLALGGSLALIAAYWITSEPATNRLFAISGGLALLGMLWMTICVLRARQVSFSQQAAAERLDAAQDAHNRIATAWSFSDTEIVSPFMQAAIAQGVAVLETANPEQPALPPLHVQILKIASAPALLLIVLSLVMLIDFTVAHRASDLPINPIAATDGLPSHPSGATTTTTPQHDRDNPTSPRPTANPALLAANQSPAASQADAVQTAKTPTESNLSGGGAAAASASPTAAAGGAQKAATSGAKASASAAKSPARTASKADQAGQANTANASIPNAAAGSNAGRATGGDVDSRDRPAGEDQLAEGDEPEPVEDSTQNNQRGGLRASLLDRRAAASRELGITGPKSKRPGTGRGGPSPAKKSRGTASIIMGVPVPDFLPGQRRPGPFISTDSRVPPTAGAASTPETTALRNGATTEALLNPHVVPYQDADVVKNYLANWHASQANQTSSLNETAPDGEQGEPTQR